MPECLIPSTTAEPAVPIRAVAAADLDRFVAALEPTAAAWVGANDFKAAAGTLLLFPGPDGRLASVVLGLGDPASDPRAALVAGALATRLPPGVYRLDTGFADPAAAALAFALGAYRFTRYRDGVEAPRLVTPEGVDAETVGAIADGVWLARDLINTAPNDMGPAELAAAAKALAARHGAEYAETVGGALLSANLPMIHAVGTAAAPSRSPRLVDLSWGDPGHPKVTLVGKGVCFDTGGLDIKPANGMLLMKKDMAGAANVIGLAHMIMARQVPVRLRVLVPAVENAISGAAFRPGDVLTSRKGLTVEIGNTDAEGRLVLGDALALASEETPDLIVDLATLTGAARTALGPDIAAFFTHDDALAGDLTKAAGAVSDPVWRLPLWTPYLSMLDSKFADIGNAGATPFAGSITAALFLSRFVAPESRWIHADIYGWTRSAEPGRPYGGEAQAIRALFTMIVDGYPAS
jgi:leucyl aminopeptidase